MKIPRSLFTLIPFFSAAAFGQILPSENDMNPNPRQAEAVHAASPVKSDINLMSDKMKALREQTDVLDKKLEKLDARIASSASMDAKLASANAAIEKLDGEQKAMHKQTTGLVGLLSISVLALGVAAVKVKK